MWDGGTPLVVAGARGSAPGIYPSSSRGGDAGADATGDHDPAPGFIAAGVLTSAGILLVALALRRPRRSA